MPIENSLYLNRWNFFTWRYNKGQFSIFLNGVKLGDQILGEGGLSTNNLPLEIGRDVYRSTEYLNGLLDELRIYNRTLTDEEISKLYRTDGFHIAEQIESAPFVNTRLRLPENIAGEHFYNVQFGRKLDFAAAGSQTTALRVPAGLYSSIELDALASGLPANAALSIDIGNDGFFE